MTNCVTCENDGILCKLCNNSKFISEDKSGCFDNCPDRKNNYYFYKI